METDLKWVEDKFDIHHARRGQTVSYVVCRTGGRVTWRSYDNEDWIEADSIEAAKAAAQADYEGRR